MPGWPTARTRLPINVRIGAYEGLVHSTTRMFAERARMDDEDFAQELRLKIWQALERFDPNRSRLPEKRYVYALMFNRVKDMIRYPRSRDDLIEDELPAASDGGSPLRDRFDMRFLSTPAEVVEEALYGRGLVPEGISEFEKEVLLLLYLEYQQVEIAPLLDVPLSRVKAAVRALREALAGLRPERPAPILRLLEGAASGGERVAA